MSGDYSGDLDLGLYPGRFHREAAPLWLAAVAASRGIAPPETTSARWCEIGCGQGTDSVLLAAANPKAEFLGIDADPAHVAAARALAERGGVKNVRFLQADVRDLAGEASPAGEAFDFIWVHGLYSWVSPEVQAAIRAFVGARLAPGGIAMLNYMCWPGAAAHLAFREALAGMGGPEVGVERRLEILRDLAAAGAGFFVAHPGAGPILQELSKRSAAFVAHEYLGGRASASRSGEVMALMRAEGLSYVGSAQPIENYDDVSLPARAATVVAAEPDPARREHLRDLARNQHLRYDLYMRAPRLLEPRERARLAQARRFLLSPGAPAPGAVRFETPIGPVEGDAAIFAPILSRLREGPASLFDLAALPAFGGRAGIVEQALMMLMWAEAVHPAAEDAASPESGALAALLDAEGGLRIEPRIGSARLSPLV